MPRRIVWILALLAAGLVAGCAFFNPVRIAPGTGVDAVQQQLGVPTGRFALAGGGERLEYARGPFGKQTWMLDFDAQGQLLSGAQVLTEKRFNAILAGMSRDDVRLAIGRPSAQSYIGWQRQVVWSYRYDSPVCQWFQIGLDEAGRVVDTGYYPDPMCEPDDNMLSMFRR
jgi:hypothetical protein